MYKGNIMNFIEKLNEYLLKNTKCSVIIGNSKKYKYLCEGKDYVLRLQTIKYRSMGYYKDLTFNDTHDLENIILDFIKQNINYVQG